MKTLSEYEIESLRNAFTQQVCSHDYRSGPLLLFAGPGTGKTYNLLQTVEAQLGFGLPLDTFLECTLTNAAADKFAADVNQRLSATFRGVCTLHSRAKGICHQHSSALRMRASFVVLSEKEYVENAKADLALLLRSTAPAVAKRLREYQNASANAMAPQDLPFAAAYRGLQRFYGAIDWYDVIAFARELLAKDADLRKQEADRHEFLLVDEYQDLNEAEQQLLELLLDGRNFLLAVGDDDQSIYSRRHAAPAGMVDFAKRYPSSRMLELPVTTRVPSAVLKAAYDLVERNPNRSQHRRRPLAFPATDERAAGGLALCVNCKSDKAEAQFIADSLALLGDECPACRVLVLCASTPLGMELEKKVHRLQPSLRLSPEFRGEDTPHDDLLMLHAQKFLNDPTDNFSLRLLLGSLDTNTRECSGYVQRALDTSTRLWDMVLRVSDERTEPRDGLRHFCAVTQEALAFEDPQARLQHFVQQVPFMTHLEARLRKPPDSSSTDKAATHESSASKMRFMSLHKSKGLDADYVFLPFMEESIGLAGQDLEEQRRLLFVAITRAKVACIMSWAWSRGGHSKYKTRGRGGPSTNRTPSPFISECGLPSSLRKPWERPIASARALQLLRKCATHVAAYDTAHS